jgi:hypothetical protein
MDWVHQEGLLEGVPGWVALELEPDQEDTVSALAAEKKYYISKERLVLR